MANWILHTFDIGMPLNIDFSVSADISTDRVNGSKTLGYLKSIEATQFKATLFKEFNTDAEETTFRDQLVQLQYGVEFMPYELITGGTPAELDSHLVLIKDINMNREGGRVRWMKYDITFVDLGHKTEFIGYIQYRAETVPSVWDDIALNRRATLYYPVGANFHSDTPSGWNTGAYGVMEYRDNSSTFTLSYQGAVGKERIDGIIVTQNGVRLFSPHYLVGAGLTVDNGRVKLVWDTNGNVTYYFYDPYDAQWYNKHVRTPYFTFSCVNDQLQSVGTVRTDDASIAYRKLQLKRLTSEYVEIEQEFQATNGLVVAVMWRMRRGTNDFQIRARGINCGLDFWYMYTYVDYNYAFGQKAWYNRTYTVVSSNTNISQDLTDPSFYLEVVNGGNTRYIGITNPDKYKLVQASIISNQSQGYVQLSTRHSWTLSKLVWSPPLMYYMGTSYPGDKEKQAGYLIDANGQVLHRSRVY